MTIAEKIKNFLEQEEVSQHPVHPWYGPCDSIAKGGCAECEETITRIADDMVAMSKHLKGLITNESLRPISSTHKELQDIYAEYYKASHKFKPFNSAHEGYSVIKEELDELWEEVKAKDRSDERMYQEAVQVAAMGLRFLIDVCRQENQ